MADALAAVEAAISEVTKARGALAKKKTRQVSSVDEIDNLKSVAFAWFRTHRPTAIAHASQPDLSRVDSAYQTIMDSTAKHASRQTYATALADAKKALASVRSFIATNLHAAPPNAAKPTTDVHPNFGPLATDAKMQSILQRRWDEVQRCLAAKANLAATVMMGGLLETLLLARINSSPNLGGVFTAKSAPKDKLGKTLSLPQWKLIHMVTVAHELTWITKSAMDVGNVLRDFRNYIHPDKEYTDGVSILDEDGRMFWEVTKSITRQVLGSVGKSP